MIINFSSVMRYCNFTMFVPLVQIYIILILPYFQNYTSFLVALPYVGESAEFETQCSTTIDISHPHYWHQLHTRMHATSAQVCDCAEQWKEFLASKNSKRAQYKAFYKFFYTERTQNSRLSRSCMLSAPQF